MTGFRMTGLVAIVLGTAATDALAYELSDVVGRWDCSHSHQASKMNARTYFTVEQNGDASSIGTVQVAGDQGMFKMEFDGRMTIEVEGNSLFETPVSTKVLSASLGGQDFDEASKKQAEAGLMTPYDAPAQILHLSSQNLVYDRDGTITDCSSRE